MITPQEYLTDRGVAIFNEIVSALNGVGKDIDTYELSMLANAYDIYESFAKKLNEPKIKVLDTQRVAAIMAKAFTQIDKQSDKYGMTPIGRDKLAKILPEQKEKPIPAFKKD